MTREATATRSPCTATKGSPCSPRLEKSPGSNQDAAQPKLNKLSNDLKMLCLPREVLCGTQLSPTMPPPAPATHTHWRLLLESSCLPGLQTLTGSQGTLAVRQCLGGPGGHTRKGLPHLENPGAQSEDQEAGTEVAHLVAGVPESSVQLCLLLGSGQGWFQDLGGPV